MENLFNLLTVTINTVRNIMKRVDRKGKFKTYLLSIIVVFFLISIFAIFYRILIYFNTVPLFGPVLISKLLAMVFLTFLFMLLFSNVIVAISTFYLSDDMNLLMATPIPLTPIIFLKFLHTIVNSSWMVFLMVIPIFAAYTFVLKAGILCFIFSIFVFLIFLILIASFGILFTMLLMRIFPAKRTRDVFVLLSIGFVCVLTVLLRLLQPEKLTNPNELLGVMEYMSSLKTPAAPYLPSAWVSQAVIGILNYNYKEAFINLGLLSVVCISLFAMFLFLSNFIFVKGWWNASENQLTRYKKKFLDRLNLREIFFYIQSNIKELVIKDIKVFFRDTAQWSQVLILISIVIIYLFNISNLPLDKLPSNVYAKYIKDVIFFLNMGFAGFIIAAVSARFVFSGISVEGKNFWIIKSIPLLPRKFLMEKFWISFFPLFFLSELLIFLSIYFLKIDLFMSLISIITICIFSISLTSMGVGFGAMFPKFDADNTADIATSYGGIIYMIFAVIYIGVSLVIIAGPVNMYYSSKMILGRINYHYVVISLILFFIVQFLAIYLPLKFGELALNKIEV
ncbi:MAG: hypothetical protein ABH873_08780 [Candidatus Firestonebacteria bacterium]